MGVLLEGEVGEPDWKHTLFQLRFHIYVGRSGDTVQVCEKVKATIGTAMGKVTCKMTVVSSEKLSHWWQCQKCPKKSTGAEEKMGGSRFAALPLGRPQDSVRVSQHRARMPR